MVASRNMVGEHPYYDMVIPFHTNSRGWRDREYPLEATARTQRIVVLGDAFTWGYRVRDREVYPEVLESLMEKTDVINLGVPGFATDQELQYFKRAGLPYHPDTVILGFYLDNIYEADGKLVNQALARPADESSNATQQSNEPAAGPVLRLKQYLKVHSALYRWGQEQLTTNRILVKILASAGLREPLGGVESLDISLLPSLKHRPASIVALIALAEAKLLELHRLLTEQGIRFIIVLIPSETSIDQRAFDQAIALTQFDRDDFDLDQPYRLLEEFARDSTRSNSSIPPTSFDKSIAPAIHSTLSTTSTSVLRDIKCSHKKSIATSLKTPHSQQARQGQSQPANSADNGLLKHSGATGPATKWPQAGTYEIRNGSHSGVLVTVPSTIRFAISASPAL